MDIVEFCELSATGIVVEYSGVCQTIGVDHTDDGMETLWRPINFGDFKQ